MRYALLLVICLIALFLRLWQINSVPPSPSLDEVSIGWNAYSLLHTGMDEYGTPFPLLLRAYDDWRPALYVYLVLPFIWLFGLSATAVRLPSVILSVASVVVTYFLVKEMMGDRGNKGDRKDMEALITAGFLAISPWHLYISRLGHEVNAGLAFLIIAILFFLRKSFIISALFFSLSFMSYQAEKIIVPIILASLAVLYYRDVLSHRKQAVIGLLVGLILTIPFLISSLKPDALIRFQGTNIISASEPIVLEHGVKRMQAIEQGNWFSVVRHNRRVVAAEIIASQYISHIKPSWLFYNAGREAHKIPYSGILWIWEGILFIIGLIAMWKKTIPVKSAIFLLVLILSAPIPASITTGSPHAMRSFTAVPAVQILAGVGAVYVYGILVKSEGLRKLGRNVSVAFLGVAVIFSVVSLFKNYFIVFPYEQSDSFQYSLKQAIQYVDGRQDKYDRIVISNEDDLYQSYMFYLLYTHYDPTRYLESGGTGSGGYAEVHQIGTVEFRPIQWDKEETAGNTLFIGNADDFPDMVMPTKQFTQLDGSQSISIVETNST